MQVDYAVELGRDDETLEFPWTALGEGPRYYDLKRQPELLGRIEEATCITELAAFLAALNSPASKFESAKCDTWASREINPEEEIFGSACKFGSYVDLLFATTPSRFSFEEHETLLKKLTGLLKRAPEIPASAEFMLRRCFYHDGEDIREGFYITFYLLGYGSDENKARQQWAIALNLVGNACMQLSTQVPSQN